MAIEAVDRVLSDEQLKDHWVRRGVAYIFDTVILVFFTVLVIAIGVALLFGMMFSAVVSEENPLPGLILISYIFFSFR